MEGPEKKSDENVSADNPNVETKVKKRKAAELNDVVDLISPPKKAVKGSVVETSPSTEPEKREASSPPKIENEMPKNHPLSLAATTAINKEMSISAQLQLVRVPGLGPDAGQAALKTIMPGNNDEISETKHSARQTVDANTEIPKASSPAAAESQEKAEVTIVSSSSLLLFLSAKQINR